MQPYSRPVILLGNGARGVDLAPILKLGVPLLTSWQAKDLVDNDHEWYFGSPGIYGQRMANCVLHGADMIMAIGNRMSIWQIGYEGPRPDQQVAMVDVDGAEVAKFPQADWIKMTAAEWINSGWAITNSDTWQNQCKKWKAQYPLVESPAHDDTTYINSYRFVGKLQKYLRSDEVIVTEMGAALCSAHQVLRLKPPQRIITSGGLGEMGCGLPFAIGASFARNKGPVLCLNTDGGMMLNLQELQTIIHHKLPIRIIVFNNSGYGMLQQTQEKAGMRLAGVNERTGVSFPDFRHVGMAFGIPAYDVRTWDDFERIIPSSMSADKPCIIDYHMDPKQLFVPKLDPVYVDGKPTSPKFSEMSPRI